MLSTEEKIMPVTFSEDDEGKTVVDASGDTLGIVTKIQRDTAYVEPDPDVTETLKSELGMGDADPDEYTVHQDAVETTTDEKLHLRGEL